MSSNTPSDSIQSLVEKLQHTYADQEIQLVYKAFNVAYRAHEGQKRRSGDPYITHPLAVSLILTELNLDYQTIVTGLLHDTVEDTSLTLQDIHQNFGADVAHLVDGVTKLSQIKFRNTHAKQGENIRKMLIAMGKDIRVIVVKLADRLHNMRTLKYMPYEKQMRISKETLEIYAPLAHRLGINAWKSELEDLSFQYLKPDVFHNLFSKMDKTKKERQQYVSDMITVLKNHFLKKNKLVATILGRSKTIYSIYTKMVEKILITMKFMMNSAFVFWLIVLTNAMKP